MAKDDDGEQPKRKTIKTDNAELVAMARIGDVLDDLSDPERFRVLNWLYARERERCKKIAMPNLWPQNLEELIKTPPVSEEDDGA